MIETSRDVLNYALALSALILTFLIAWILWYIVGIFREIKRLTGDISKAVEKFSRAMDEVREKLGSLASVIPFIMKSAERVIESLRRARAARGGDSRDSEKDAGGGKKQKRT